jgi:hypothetical protein
MGLSEIARLPKKLRRLNSRNLFQVVKEEELYVKVSEVAIRCSAGGRGAHRGGV